jgi:DNA-entry nuclease
MTPPMDDTTYSVDTVPSFNGSPYIEINGNEPTFTAAELVTDGYETYTPLDLLGRCGAAVACVGKEMMPTEERGSIGSVKPSGWQTVKYDIVDGKYLYNRWHLIGYQLTGENANEQNLITGTRYLNMEGMLPFENLVADYVKETGNHVLYRVTPVFDGSNLIARGVQIEAKSVEDKGKGICFNVYVYNNQPGIAINYVNGESKIDDGKPFEVQSGDGTYIININTMKFHKPDCSSAKRTKEENKDTTDKSREELIDEGYAPCKQCNP